MDTSRGMLALISLPLARVWRDGQSAEGLTNTTHTAPDCHEPVVSVLMSARLNAKTLSSSTNCCMLVHSQPQRLVSCCSTTLSTGCPDLSPPSPARELHAQSMASRPPPEITPALTTLFRPPLDVMPHMSACELHWLSTPSGSAHLTPINNALLYRALTTYQHLRLGTNTDTLLHLTHSVSHLPVCSPERPLPAGANNPDAAFLSRLSNIPSSSCCSQRLRA
jgi:hypothetical protein